MSDRLTQIGSFSSDIPAQLARARLEAAGIRSFLTNELGSAAGGAIGLQVAESDADRAGEILGAGAPAPLPEPEAAAAAACVMCRSTQLEYVDWALPVRLLRGILLMVVPLPSEWFTRSRTRCLQCGYEQPVE